MLTVPVHSSRKLRKVVAASIKLEVHRGYTVNDVIRGKLINIIDQT